LRKLLQAEADEANSLPLGIFAHIEERQEEPPGPLLQKLQRFDLVPQGDLFFERAGAAPGLEVREADGGLS